VTLFVNWLVKPFSMALLGWIFVRHLFAGWLPADQLDSYIAGLILLAAAPCTAMVFVWSQLCKGDPYSRCRRWRSTTPSWCGLRAHRRPAAGPVVDHRAVGHADHLGRALHRRAGHDRAGHPKALLARGEATYKRVVGASALSIAALLATLVLLFGFQGEAIVEQPLVILLLAVPILIQVLFNSGLAYWLNRKLAWRTASPALRR
jgi:ACR3 family arsenite transporter